MILNSIDARITALAEAIERRKAEQEAPVDDLSRSLYEMFRELRQLDAHGLDALFTEQDILSREEFDRFVSDYSKF